MTLQRISLKTPIGKKREDLIPVLSGEHNRAIDFVNALDSNITALESSKQDLLVSGTNIKTIGGVSILGTGNISVASAFTGLSDVPTSYTSQSLKGVRVNAGETALEFYTITDLNTNLANTNLTLDANRSHSLAGFTLGFTGGDVGFGIASPTAQIHVVGTNDLSGTYAAKIGGATTSGLQVRNDGKVGVGMGVNPFVAEFNAYSSRAGGLVGYLKNTNTGTSTFTRLQLDSADSVTGFILGQYGANYTFNADFTEGSSISAYRSNLMLTLWGGTYAQIKDIKFGIYEDGTNTYTELARLKKDGNFGLGVSPSYKLDVVGDINTTTVYRVGGVSGFTGTGAYTNFTIVGGIITSAT